MMHLSAVFFRFFALGLIGSVSLVFIKLGNISVIVSSNIFSPLPPLFQGLQLHIYFPHNNLRTPLLLHLHVTDGDDDRGTQRVSRLAQSLKASKLTISGFELRASPASELSPADLTAVVSSSAVTGHNLP